MMQKLGRDWIIEQVDELAINFGSLSVVRDFETRGSLI
jgi:hypothetical protein